MFNKSQHLLDLISKKDYLDVLFRISPNQWFQNMNVCNWIKDSSSDQGEFTSFGHDGELHLYMTVISIYHNRAMIMMVVMFVSPLKSTNPGIDYL